MNNNVKQTDCNKPEIEKQPITIKDFQRLVNAIEREETKRISTVVALLFPLLQKEYQSGRAIARQLDVSPETVSDWLKEGAKYYFKRVSYQKGGDDTK